MSSLGASDHAPKSLASDSIIDRRGGVVVQGFITVVGDLVLGMLPKHVVIPRSPSLVSIPI